MKWPEDFIDKIIEGDCLQVMQSIPDQSVDLIFADLPYSKTDCKWDIPIPLDELWTVYKRIIKPNGVILFTAVQPFASKLVESNPKWFKYDWVWIKTQAANFQLAKKMPLKKHEYVLVFYNKRPTYNPKMWKGQPKMKRIGKKKYQDRKSEMYLSSRPANLEAVRSDTYYPTTILQFDSVSRNRSQHPTQKPVSLLAYLIETYSNPGEVVLDNVIGSGTTALAAKQTGRHFIGIEKDEKYCNIACERLQALY